MTQALIFRLNFLTACIAFCCTHQPRPGTQGKCWGVKLGSHSERFVLISVIIQATLMGFPPARVLRSRVGVMRGKHLVRFQTQSAMFKCISANIIITLRHRLQAIFSYLAKIWHLIRVTERKCCLCALLMMRILHSSSSAWLRKNRLPVRKYMSILINEGYLNSARYLDYPRRQLS